MSRTGIAAGVLWAAVVGLLMIAWVMMAVDREHWRTAGMFAATGCALAPLAATVHIKTYACRVSRLVRLTAGLEGDDLPPRAQLRPMR